MMLTFNCLSCNRAATFVAACSLLLGACTTVETQSFRAGQGDAVESAQISTDADFSRYDRLHAVDMGIYFPQSAVPPADDLQRIRDIFRTAFFAELSDYDIVYEPGPGAMTVQATLIDFRHAAYRDTMSVAEDLRDMVAPGKIVFLMEMRDSVSDRVLARAGDSAKTPAIAGQQGEMTDWASVEDAARHWAVLFRQFLDDNLGG